MLGQPVYFLTPDVVGVHLTGQLREGVTATDLVLTVTEMLRKAKVVGKFVEFFGEGAATLSVARPRDDRQHGARVRRDDGLLPGRRGDRRLPRGAPAAPTSEIDAFAAYFKAQGLFGIPRAGEIDYTQVVEARPRARSRRASPGRSGRRTASSSAASRSSSPTLFSKPSPENGFGKPAAELAQASRVEPPTWTAAAQRSTTPTTRRCADRCATALTSSRWSTTGRRPTACTASGRPEATSTIGNGDVLIAAITSCTNTSNPSVMLAAGLLAKKAVETRPDGQAAHQDFARAGLARRHRVPDQGRPAALSRPARLQPRRLRLHDLHRQLRRPRRPRSKRRSPKNDLVCAAVLSGNRNFEARIHPNLKANFLTSAAAGRRLRDRRHGADSDLTTEPLGKGTDGRDVYLRTSGRRSHEIAAVMKHAMNPRPIGPLRRGRAERRIRCGNGSPARAGRSTTGRQSTYIEEPPFFDGFEMQPRRATIGIKGARALGIFGDSVTTDHISPAGSIKESSPAGMYLKENGVVKADFNSYGSRRGNHDVMMRGTFANVRIKNLMVPPGPDGSREEGGVTLFQPDRGEKMSIYDAAMKYMAEGTPTVVFGGEEYGTGRVARLGRQGHAAARRQGRRRARASSASTARTWSAWACCRCSSSRATQSQSLGIDGNETFDLGDRLGAPAAAGRDARHPRSRRPTRTRDADLAHRHADRGRLLPARRHPAVRAAPAARGLKPDRAATTARDQLRLFGPSQAGSGLVPTSRRVPSGRMLTCQMRQDAWSLR